MDKRLKIPITLANGLTRLMEFVGVIVDIFCRASLYAVAGLCGVIAIQYYFIVQSLPIHKLDLKADITANIIAFWQAKGVELSMTQMYGIAVFIWASLAVVLMLRYLSNTLTQTALIRMKREMEINNE